MTRDLVFFPDYGATPVWDAQTGAMVDLGELPISQVLRTDLRRWATVWTDRGLRELGQEEEGTIDLELQTALDERSAVEAGHLRARLRSELGESFRVGRRARDAAGRRVVEWDS